MNFNLLTEAKGYMNELTDIRRKLHRCAGTGFDLSDTLAIVREQLQKLGIPYEKCGKAGLTATVTGKNPGKVFLLRADMDALPIKEESGEDFAAENGNMHACGHDIHTAMLLGAAKLIKAHEDTLCGTVKFMFQPAEEILAGAKDMLENGLLADPKPDAAMMIHVMAGMPFPAGTAITSAPGISAPAADFFEIHVQGVGCHGSMPNTGIDPLSAAAHIVIALQELHARELAISDQAALTIGTFHAGTAANAIPDTAVLCGSMRALDEEVRAYLKKRLEEIAVGITSAFRAKATVTFTSSCPTLYNDPTLADETARYMKELLGETGAFSVPELAAKFGGTGTKVSGSEDFAYVSRAVPSIMVALAAGNPAEGYTHPLHHPQVRFDESAMPAGAAAYAYTAMRWLSEHND